MKKNSTKGSKIRVTVHIAINLVEWDTSNQKDYKQSNKQEMISGQQSTWSMLLQVKMPAWSCNTVHEFKSNWRINDFPCIALLSRPFIYWQWQQHKDRAHIFEKLIAHLLWTRLIKCDHFIQNKLSSFLMASSWSLLDRRLKHLHMLTTESVKCSDECLLILSQVLGWVCVCVECVLVYVHKCGHVLKVR